MLRSPAVAGQFYPGDHKTLTAMLSKLVPDIAPDQKIQALAVVVPHAGYVYSGGVAGETFSKVTIPRDIIILGPNHHGYGPAISLMASGTWQMPMGDVLINEKLAALIRQESPLIEADHLAHRFEHSLEVQVPFLQYLRADITITPLVISHISLATCLEAGRAIAKAIKKYNRPTLLVASTDMTHYESRQIASKNDQSALEEIRKLSPEGLYNTVMDNRISMCGVMPTTIVLTAAMALDATKSELIRYTDSGETSGDTNQVVGYAGFVIS